MAGLVTRPPSPHHHHTQRCEQAQRDPLAVATHRLLEIMLNPQNEYRDVVAFVLRYGEQNIGLAERDRRATMALHINGDDSNGTKTLLWMAKNKEEARQQIDEEIRLEDEHYLKKFNQHLSEKQQQKQEQENRKSAQPRHGIFRHLFNATHWLAGEPAATETSGSKRMRDIWKEQGKPPDYIQAMDSQRRSSLDSACFDPEPKCSLHGETDKQSAHNSEKQQSSSDSTKTIPEKNIQLSPQT